jgi:hypothetical protein
VGTRPARNIDPVGKYPANDISVEEELGMSTIRKMWILTKKNCPK